MPMPSPLRECRCVNCIWHCVNYYTFRVSAFPLEFIWVLLFSRLNNENWTGRDVQIKKRINQLYEETIAMLRRSLLSGSFRHNCLSWKIEIAIENCFWSACFLTHPYRFNVCMFKKITLDFLQGVHVGTTRRGDSKYKNKSKT